MVDVILHLIHSKCLPVLLYGLEVCPLSRADLHSLDCCVNRILMKLFCTNNIVIVDECRVDIFSISNYRVDSCVSALLSICAN